MYTRRYSHALASLSSNEVSPIHALLRQREPSTSTGIRTKSTLARLTSPPNLAERPAVAIQLPQRGNSCGNSYPTGLHIDAYGFRTRQASPTLICGPQSMRINTRYLRVLPLTCSTNVLRRSLKVTNWCVPFHSVCLSNWTPEQRSGSQVIAVGIPWQTCRIPAVLSGWVIIPLKVSYISSVTEMYKTDAFSMIMLFRCFEGLGRPLNNESLNVNSVSNLDTHRQSRRVPDRNSIPHIVYVVHKMYLCTYIYDLSTVSEKKHIRHLS